MTDRLRSHPIAALILLAALSSSAAAREISFPIHLEHPFIRQLVVETLFTGAGESTRVWQDANKCNDIVLSKPRVSGRDGKLHLVADFNAKLGAAIGSWCLNVTDWEGVIDAAMAPRLHPNLPIVEFRVVDSNMYGKDGAKTFTGTLWDWVKSQVHPRLESIRIDLYRPVTELKTFLPVLFPVAESDRTQQLLDSVALTDVTVSEQDLTVRVQLNVPEASPSTPVVPVPEPTLSIDEVERWEKAWQSWDAFLTFLVKHAGGDAVDEVRGQLREVFLEARYDIVEILRPSEPRDSDPVRPLFLKTWKRLAPILRHMTTNLPGETALRYMSFVTAADALAALEQLGPEYGVDISTDGLRRLARIIEPAPFSDPTAYSEDVDPELRKMFGFGPPPPTPVLQDTETPAPEEAEETPTAAVSEETPTPAVSEETLSRQEPPPNPLLGKEGGLVGLRVRPYQGGTTGGVLAFVSGWVEGAAWAATEDSDAQEGPIPPAPFPRREGGDPLLAAAPRKLDRWIPTRDELVEYLQGVRDLLLRTQEETRKEKPLEERYSILFRNMMLTTAWQESCWRQFIKRKGALQPLTSPVGAVGIMQVNVRVWRGFYEQNALRESMAYNAKAGSEIMRHYLVDYAIAKGELKVRGDLDDLARATYAAYNGGPGKLRRYRQQAGGKSGHRIDEAFWKKYQQIKAGNDLAVASCFGVTSTG